MTQTESRNTVLLEEMSSSEISAAIKAGWDTCIVPLGSIEAHGPHLPVNTDAFLARHVSIMAAARLSRALVAPTITLGYVPRTRFAGSISIPVGTVMEVLKAYCTALERDGFRIVAFLPMHAEHFQTLALFSPQLGEQFRNLTIVAGLDVSAFIAMRNEIAASFHISPDEAGWHAGAAETSEMLSAQPTAVRKEAFRRGFLGPSGFGRILPDTLRDGWVALDPDGVMGDPSKSDERFGAAILEAMVDLIVSEIRLAGGE